MGTDRLPLDPDALAARIGSAASDAAAVAIGLGLLGVNRIQALRREVEERLADARSPSGDHDAPPGTHHAE